MGIVGKVLYLSREEGFKEKIIEKYLPKLISGEITFKMIEQELNTNHHTVSQIINEYYLSTGDDEGLEAFKKSQKRNSGIIWN